MKKNFKIELCYSPGIGWENKDTFFVSDYKAALKIKEDWESNPTHSYNAGSEDDPSFRSSEYKCHITEVDNAN